MFAKIKHLAIVSNSPKVEGEFYATLFGLRSSVSREAVVVWDGYVGLNINPRAPGRQAGFNHFGFEVEDVELVYARMRESYPSIQVLKRPSNRPFAGISTYDPAGNIFDLSQQGMDNRRDVYVEGKRDQQRQIRHFALRVLDPEGVARFYRDVFQLMELEKPAGDSNYYLSDGQVTLVIYPWNIADYAGTGIERPQLDHIGFKVESVESVKRDLEAMAERNPALAAVPVGKGLNREGRLKLFEKCSYGQHHFADPDGVLIDIAER